MDERAEAVEVIVPTISVGASATVEAVPDEAQLDVDLSADARSSNGALDAVRKRLDAVDLICDRLEVAKADRSSTVTVNEHHERDGGRWLTKGYRATANLRLVVRDADTVGPLVSALVEEAGPAVRGPWWRISNDHPARLEVCTKAGTQARGKAEAYAAALGVELGAVISATEPGVSVRTVRAQSMPPSPGPAPMAMARSTESAEAPPVIDLHPGTQDVFAQVDVVFRINTEERGRSGGLDQAGSEPVTG